MIGVTAATGHLGSLAVDKLLERVPADEVVAIVRDPEKAKSLPVAARIASYDDAEAWPAALQDVDRLLLVSGSEVGKRLEQHTTVVQAAAAAGIAQLVYTSSPRVEGSTLLVVPEHAATEDLIRDSGVPFTLLRNNWYHENYAPAIEQARETGKIANAIGTEVRIPSAARADLAEAAAIVLTTDGHLGKTYELTGATAWTMTDLAAVAADITGRPVVYETLTLEQQAAVLAESGMPAEFAHAIAGMDLSIGAGDLGEPHDDLARLLGREPTTLAATLGG